MSSKSEPATVEEAWDRLLGVVDYVAIQGPDSSYQFLAQGMGPMDGALPGRSLIGIATGRTLVDALNALYHKVSWKRSG